MCEYITCNIYFVSVTYAHIFTNKMVILQELTILKVSLCTHIFIFETNKS